MLKRYKGMRKRKTIVNAPFPKKKHFQLLKTAPDFVTFDNTYN